MGSSGTSIRKLLTLLNMAYSVVLSFSTERIISNPSFSELRIVRCHSPIWNLLQQSPKLKETKQLHFTRAWKPSLSNNNFIKSFSRGISFTHWKRTHSENWHIIDFIHKFIFSPIQETSKRQSVWKFLLMSKVLPSRQPSSLSCHLKSLLCYGDRKIKFPENIFWLFI